MIRKQYRCWYEAALEDFAQIGRKAAYTEGPRFAELKQKCGYKRASQLERAKRAYNAGLTQALIAQYK